jgi:hypothetical protein
VCPWRKKRCGNHLSRQAHRLFQPLTIHKFRLYLPDFWNQRKVVECLIETLGFITEDAYEFSFSRNPKPTPFERFLGFGDSNPEGIEKVALFSGGVDSLSGAVEEVLHSRRKVALVSHWPVSHLGSRQDQLAARLADCVQPGNPKPVHLKVLANKVGTFDHEHTQRSRSFLFSSIASVVAHVFGINAVDFYENGIVSVNLPLCEQEVNGRASRTTHPQSLHRLSELMSLVADKPFLVRNNYLDLTKQDVVERLKKMGHSELLSDSISCTHTRQFTNQKPHCGSCSQCLSRKFATCGAGSDQYDPDDTYRSDVFIGGRKETAQRTLAERFVGVARKIEFMGDATEFQRMFANDIARITPYLPGSSRDVISKLFDLHRRHAIQVGSVVESKMKQYINEFRCGQLANTSTLWFAFELSRGGPKPSSEPAEINHHAEVAGQVRLLKEMERCIVQAIAEKNITDPQLDQLPSQQTVAQWAGYDYDTNLKNSLTSLVKAQLLDNGKHHGRRGGYFLTDRGVLAAKLLSESNGHD